jgi:hypothetical protein
MRDRRDHPCLSCHLPDCDDSSPRCPLRKAYSEAIYLRRQGLPIDDDLIRRKSIAFNELYHWPRAERERQKASKRGAE